ncbi:MAG: lysophospholipid acyltransferase family protein, partial [Chromatiales bacterium]|nr:lysophospholipid acyltransferase family protein [Chromatiales bacterium]
MYYLVKAFIAFLALFPLRVNHIIGHSIGLLFYHTQNRTRQVSETNIQICFPDWSKEQRQALLKKSLIEFGKTLTETAPLWRWDKNSVLDYLTISNEEIMQDAMNSSKGVIFLTPHLGCWEIAGLYLGEHSSVTTLYQQPKIKALDNLTRTARGRSGATLVNTGRRGIMALLKALKSGQSVGILPDQTPKALNSGVFAPFFGQPALTMNLISSLGNKSEAMIVVGFAERKAKGEGYHLHLMMGDREISDPDPIIAATALNRQVEVLIRMMPEQYQWSYKRFKKVP